MTHQCRWQTELTVSTVLFSLSHKKQLKHHTAWMRLVDWLVVDNRYFTLLAQFWPRLVCSILCWMTEVNKFKIFSLGDWKSAFWHLWGHILLHTVWVKKNSLPAVFWHFYPRDAMLARVIAIATCLSVRLSVCPSRAAIVSKRRKLASWFLHHLVAPRL